MNIAFCLMKHDCILQNKNVAGGVFCGFASILTGMMGECGDSGMLLLLLHQVREPLEKPYVPSGE